MGEESKEITGRYQRLAILAREYSGGLSSRVAARKSGVSYDTVQRLWNGDRPKADTLLRFCTGMRFDAEKTKFLMEAAGYAATAFPEIVREPASEDYDPRVAILVKQFRDAAPDEKDLIYDLTMKVTRRSDHSKPGEFRELTGEEEDDATGAG